MRSCAAVCAVVRDFRSTRVLQISTRPEPFWTVMFNEGELLERFGLQVFPVTLQEVVCELEPVSYTHLDVYKRQCQDG